MKRKIYIASSWKNATKVREIAMTLRDYGHEVFDFTDPSNTLNGIEKYVFSAARWSLEGEKPADQIEWKDFLSWVPSKKAFASDKAGLDWADTVLLINPSGRSSHLEVGYGAGKGKDVYIFGDLPLGEFDAMYGFAKGNCFRESEFADMILKLNGNAVNRQ